MAKSKKVVRTSVTREELNQLFVALGAKSPSKWNDARLRLKLADLPGVSLDSIANPTLRGVADFLIGVIEDERLDELSIVDSVEEEQPQNDPAPKKAKKPKLPTKEEVGHIPEIEEEINVQEESPAGQNVGMKKKKPLAKGVAAPRSASAKNPTKPAVKKASKADKEKKPGVISTILETLQAASAKKPVSKEDIVKKLVAAFPDRDEDGMRKTVNVQVPTRLGSDKGVTVQKNEAGYWVD